MKFRPFRIKFHLGIAGGILAAILLMATASLLVVLVGGNAAAARNAHTLFASVAQTVQEQTEERFRDTVTLAVLAARVPELKDPVAALAEDTGAAEFFRGLLVQGPGMYSAYVGRTDGSFLQWIRAGSAPGGLPGLPFPAGTAWVLRTIRAADHVQAWKFLDAEGKVLGTHREGATSFDPRTRPWFAAALGHAEGILSAPYVFQSLQKPGITASAPLTDHSGVVGVDLTMGELNTFLSDIPVPERGQVSILGPDKTVLAESPAPAAARGILTLSRAAAIAGQALEIRVSAPASDFETDFRSMQLEVVVALALLLALLLPLAIVFSRRLSEIIAALTLDVERVWRLDFTGSLPAGSVIEEFNLLTAGFSMMKGTLSARTLALDDAKLKLKRIVELANDLSAEKDINRLTELILQGAKELTRADAGSLYLVDKDRKKLVFQIVLTDSLGFKQGGTSGHAVTLPPVSLYTADGSENRHNVVSTAFLSELPVNIADAYDDDRFDFSGTKKFDQANGYRSKSFLTIPLKPRGGDVIGALQLINAQDPTPEDPHRVGVFTSEMEEYVSALTSIAATALYNRDLLEAQKELFEAVIQLIAGAIDTKSPYTGGHCARVPVLAMMLADAAAGTKEGPLVGFEFATEEHRREFRIAAWLHDAGKVTTPEYVVDKATKLETIYNRIHEVRTRFEVLLRDARIARLEAIVGGADPAEQDRILAAEEAQLQEDFAFLAQANLGAEFLAPEMANRIRTLGQKTWLRHFDDRLGISWEEQRRCAEGPVQGLPAEETLLADKSLHIFKRGNDFHQLYDGYGFKIPIPEHLYNQGEVYNLTIGRGTLSAEERFKINEHVMQSIVMLEKLPLPDTLKRVPEIAGQHHETLVGTGYPRALAAESLSVESRILTIADIFEALSASDRPYKKPKTLSECVKVLSMFKKDKHIDPDLFDLFLTSGVYREYAVKYLQPDQVDEVDIRPYLG